MIFVEITAVFIYTLVNYRQNQPLFNLLLTLSTVIFQSNSKLPFTYQCEYDRIQMCYWSVSYINHSLGYYVNFLKILLVLLAPAVAGT